MKGLLKFATINYGDKYLIMAGQMKMQRLFVGT